MGGALGVLDLCVRRALWKRKSVWPDGGPASLKGSFLTVWAKQHSWLDWPELITEREEGIYMVFICVGICPTYTVRLSFPMNSLHVQINTHTFHNLQILKILSNICFCHNRHWHEPTRTHTYTHAHAFLWSPWLVYEHFVATANTVIFSLAWARCISSVHQILNMDSMIYNAPIVCCSLHNKYSMSQI